MITHTFKIWERVLNRRLQYLTKVTENQCGFVRGRLTTDAIQNIRMFLEKYQKKKFDLHMVFIDLEKAFDKVPRRLIWEALRKQIVPEYYIKLLMDMYDDINTKVWSPARESELFEIKMGVHQGSALSPLLFNLVMDYITAHIQRPTPKSMLDADDVVLMDETPEGLQCTLNKWREALESNGLRISRTRTEYMPCYFSGQRPETPNALCLQETPMPVVESFKYLGTVLSPRGGVDGDIAHRTKLGWMKWRSVSGVLCDKRMPVKVKGQVYKSVVRPTMTYSSECWTLKSQHSQSLHRNEMKILRWAGGVTKADRVKNVHIRGSFKVAPIHEKITENRLRWYGHVMRLPQENMITRAIDISIGARRPGRPLTTWMSTIRKDLKEAELRSEDAGNRKTWRLRTRRADPK